MLNIECYVILNLVCKYLKHLVLADIRTPKPKKTISTPRYTLQYNPIKLQASNYFQINVILGIGLYTVYCIWTELGQLSFSHFFLI